MKICFATNNQHKLREVQQMLGHGFEIVDLKSIGCEEELPETGDTMEANSLEKAAYVFNKYSIPCFADDSGLEVDVLGGAPGVYSARYAGLQRNNEDNIQLLLKNMAGQSNRKARFKAVVTLMTDEGPAAVTGIVDGKILTEKQGTDGFGYDPIFVPDGHQETFAEMSATQKNSLSHRGRAIEKLAILLKEKFS